MDSRDAHANVSAFIRVRVAFTMELKGGAEDGLACISTIDSVCHSSAHIHALRNGHDVCVLHV